MRHSAPRLLQDAAGTALPNANTPEAEITTPDHPTMRSSPPLNTPNAQFTTPLNTPMDSLQALPRCSLACQILHLPMTACFCAVAVTPVAHRTVTDNTRQLHHSAHGCYFCYPPPRQQVAAAMHTVVQSANNKEQCNICKRQAWSEHTQHRASSA
jgi:hypothetical protein